MRKLLLALACSAALISPALAQPPPGIYDHNGSVMRLVYNGNGNGNGNASFGVYYEVVRPGLIETIPPGSPRFEGHLVNGHIVGNAYVYTKYCPGARFPYRVEGLDIGAVIQLFGPAAVVDPSVCAIVGYRPDSDNAHVAFQLVQPAVVAIPPPPVIVAPPPPVIVAPPPVVVAPPPPVVIPTPVPSVGDITKGHTVICPVVGPCLAPPAPLAPKELSPDDQAAALKRQGQEFCWKFPGHPDCAPPPPSRPGPHKRIEKDDPPPLVEAPDQVEPAPKPEPATPIEPAPATPVVPN